MYWTKFTKLCDVILNNAIGLCTLYNDSSVISKIKLLLFYQKNTILAHLGLKRILEYLLGTQKKKFKEYSNTKSYYSFKP